MLLETHSKWMSLFCKKIPLGCLYLSFMINRNRIFSSDHFVKLKFIGDSINEFRNLYSIFLIVLCIFLCSCSYDKKEDVSLSDATLFELIESNVGYRYFKNSIDTLVSDAESDHGSFVRIRFNSIAVAALNSDLSNLNSSKFPDGSIVVKEIYDVSGENIVYYAAMFKSSVDKNSSGSWLWAEYRADGETFYSATKGGVACTGCHSASGNADLVRTFSLH